MNLTIEEIKSISIVDYLSRHGYEVSKVLGNKYWYLSPLPYHNEKHASFKVDANVNMWYDFAIGKGGNIINLVQELHPEKSKKDVIVHLKEFIGGFIDTTNSRLVPSLRCQVQRNNDTVSDTAVVKIVELSNPNLLKYLDSRRINLEVARKYCKEVYYTFKGQYQFYAIAFMNQSGGMETRNIRFKRCIGGKNISLIQHERERKACCVFEGFFDFLSYKTATLNQDTWLCVEEECDYLILNSATMTDKAVPYLSRYERIYCYLDNDVAGKTATNILWDFLGNKMKDQSHLYSKFNDVNDFLTSNEKGKSDGTDRVE